MSGVSKAVLGYMAQEEINKSNIRVLKLNRQEATDIISLLAAQLADRPLKGSSSGACPVLTIYGSEGSIPTQTQMAIIVAYSLG